MIYQDLPILVKTFIMKAIICQAHGLPNTLIYDDIPEPQIDAHEVLIRVEACAVNYPDILMIQDKYQVKPDLPFSPGGEVCGIVEKVGSEVTHLYVGQHVLALCGWGGFAEKVKVTAERVFEVPQEIDAVSAAASLYTFATAYHALKDRAMLKSGETMLVMGASGGVGLAAVVLGKLMGAHVMAAGSSLEKLEICKTYGAEVLMDYNKDDFKERIKEATNGKGVDVVLDVVGGKYADPAMRGMAWKGRYLIAGFTSGEIPKIPFNLPLLKGCAVLGVFWGRFSKEEPEAHRQNIKALTKLLVEGKIKHHVFKTYKLNEASKALQDMMDRKIIGKAVVTIS